MHVSGHLKPLMHEAHGSHQTGGPFKKKTDNPDEVGAVKDHFSEGRQQKQQRHSAPKHRPVEDEIMPFEAAETPFPSQKEFENAAQRASQIEAAQLASFALHSLLKDAVPGAADGDSTVQPPKTGAQEEPSLDDLLSLMRGVL